MAKTQQRGVPTGLMPRPACRLLCHLEGSRKEGHLQLNPAPDGPFHHSTCLLLLPTPVLLMLLAPASSCVPPFASNSACNHLLLLLKPAPFTVQPHARLGPATSSLTSFEVTRPQLACPAAAFSSSKTGRHSQHHCWGWLPVPTTTATACP